MKMEMKLPRMIRGVLSSFLIAFIIFFIVLFLVFAFRFELDKFKIFLIENLEKHKKIRRKKKKEKLDDFVSLAY